MALKPARPSRPERRLRGFEAAAGLVSAQIRTAGETRGFVVTRLLTHWAEIAGPEIATRCRPVKVSYGKGGMGATLTLLTTGAAGPMLQMQLPALRDKVNACYGYNAVARICLTQTAATGFAEGQAQFTPAPTGKSRAPLPEAKAKAAELSRNVQDTTLREALERLALNVLSKRQETRGPRT